MTSPFREFKRRPLHFLAIARREPGKPRLRALVSAYYTVLETATNRAPGQCAGACLRYRYPPVAPARFSAGPPVRRNGRWLWRDRRSYARPYSLRLFRRTDWPALTD